MKHEAKVEHQIYLFGCHLLRVRAHTHTHTEAEAILYMLIYKLCVLHSLRGIGAVVYRVPELENDQLLKISLRSVDSEDTTPISQVHLHIFLKELVFYPLTRVYVVIATEEVNVICKSFSGIRRWWTSKCQFFFVELCRI